MQTVLVVGGAGYVGSHCAKLLHKRGYKVVVLDDLSTGHKDAARVFAKEEDIFVGSYGDSSLTRRIFGEKKISAILHFGAKSIVGESVKSPMRYYEENVGGTIQLLKTALDCGVKQVVFSSTCATFGLPDTMPMHERLPQKPVNPYGWTKLFVERILYDFSAAYGLKAAVLRYFNAAGADPDGELGEDHRPETHLIPRILTTLNDPKEKLSIFGDDYPTRDGTCIRDYVHVNDLGEAHVLALEKLQKLAGGVIDYNLGSEKGYTNFDVVRAVEKVTGKKVPYEVGPRREGDAVELVADSSKAKNELGWKPKHSLEDMIAAAYKFFEKHPKGFKE